MKTTKTPDLNPPRCPALSLHFLSSRLFSRLSSRLRAMLPALLAIACLQGCTGQIPNSFRLAQQQQSFSANLQVNTKIDLLWVVDNSSSMDTAQDKLRKGFTGFAQKYMQPTWDIRVGVITTDTYLANPAYAAYLGTTMPGTTGWKSPYVNGRLSTFVNPRWNPNLVNLDTGAFPNGVTYNDLVPAWGPDYAKLLPGIHDGPVAGFCFEGQPYLLKGVTQCPIRDNQLAYNGPSHCLNPVGSETAVTQCVNTIENDTVHSGTAVISTLPPSPLSGPALTAWQSQLYSDFIINITTGSNGSGSERGMQSVLQLIHDNETAGSPSRFFRAGSVRAIIFVSDEDDQTFVTDDPVPAGYEPFSHYQCDQNSLIALNGAGPITGTNGYCCDTPGNNCVFGAEGTSCPAKTVDGFTYTIGLCPVTSRLMPVSQIKSQLDAFFLNLDGQPAGAGGATGTSGATGATGATGASAAPPNPNYFVVSIVALTGASIQALQQMRAVDDTNAGVIKYLATDRGDRYLTLGNLVGNGSMAMDIGASDYSSLLDSIGMALIQKEGSFTLQRAPTDSEQMIVWVVHPDGTSTLVNSSQYSIQGKTIVITDVNVILGFQAGDQIVINYQPKTVY